MVETLEIDRTLLQQWQILSEEYAELPRKRGEVQGTRKKEVLAQALPLFKTIITRRVQSFDSGAYVSDTLIMECLKQVTSVPVTAPVERVEQLNSHKINHLVISQPDDELVLFYQLQSLNTHWGYIRFGFTKDNLPPGKKLKDMPIDKVYWRITADELPKYQKLHGLSKDEMEILERNYDYLYMYPVREVLFLSEINPIPYSEIGPMALSRISKPETPTEIEPLPLNELTRDFFRVCTDGELPSWEKYLRKLWRELKKCGAEDGIVEVYNALLREAWLRGVGIEAEEAILADSSYVSPMHVGPERITPDYLKSITKEDLLLLHARLHILYNKLATAGRDTDAVVNAHIFLLAELASRGIEHQPISAIDEIGVVEEEDPPKPEEDVQNFLVSRPYAYLIGSDAMLESGRDFEVLVKGKVNLSFEAALQNLLGDEGGKVHTLSAPGGSLTRHLPIYSMGYFRNPIDLQEQNKESVESSDLKTKLRPLFEKAPCVWYTLGDNRKDGSGRGKGQFGGGRRNKNDESCPDGGPGYGDGEGRGDGKNRKDFGGRKFSLIKEDWEVKLPKGWEPDRILFKISKTPIKYDLAEFTAGLVIELEHGSALGSETDITKDDPHTTGKIALAHLKEFPDYYTRLVKMEAEAKYYNECSYVHYHVIGDAQDKALEFRLKWQTKGKKAVFHYVTAPPAAAKPLLTRGWIPEVDREIVALDKDEEKSGDVSAQDGEVKLMRFFYPMKPKSAAKEGEPQTEDTLVNAFSDADFPVYSTKNFVGLNTEIHKQGEDVKIFSDLGEDVTHRFPRIVSHVKRLEGDFVLLAEIEWWSDRQPEIMQMETTELSCYIGSKRAFADRIAGIIPDNCKTLFDPMCGSGKVLLEAKKKGITVYGSDVNPIAGYLTKVALSGKAISREDFEKILNAKPHSGYFSKMEKPARLKKIPKKVKNYLDGMVRVVHSFSGEKKTLAMGFMAGFLSTMQANVAFGSVPERAWNLKVMKRRAEAIFREMQRYTQIEGPPGHILVKNITKRDIPKVDVVYFDPPYDSKYLSSNKDPLYRIYNLAASVLLQKEFKYPDLDFADLPALIGRLAKEAEPKVFMVSSDSKSKTPYKTVLSNLGFSVKMKRFKRKQMHHGPGPMGNRAAGKMPAESLYYGVKAKEDARKLQAEPLFEDILETERTIKRFPAEFITGYVKEASTPDDSEMVANVYDIVYKGTDIHKQTFEERLEALQSLGIEQSTMGIPHPSERLNLVPALKADSREELAEQTVKVSDALGSEGNVAKPADSLYRLKQGSGRQLQFNKSVVLNVVILRKNDGKVEDVYTYDYGIKPGDFEIHAGDKILLDDEEYAKVGTTLPTKASFEPLDRIQVEVETLNFGEYPENKVRISGYPPRLLGCGEELDDMGTVKEKAEKNGVLVQKRYGVEGLPKLLTCNENTLLTKVKEYDASEMRDDDLLDDWRIVNTWWANFKEGKKLEHDEETIRNLGRKIFRELVRRGKLTFHPESLSENALNFLETLLEYEADTRGFILKDAELIGDAKKKAIVRARPFEFDGFHSLAGTDGKVWGWVRFGFTKENTPEGIKASKDVFIRIDGDDFKKLRKYHWITDSEKEQWWPGKSKLYFHPIREFVPYSGKHKIDVPSDHQGYVKGMFIEEQVGAYEAHNESDITDVKLSVLPLDAKANAEIKKWRSLSRQGLEKYDPNKLPVGFFHLANHFRGETAHMDFRFKFLGGQEARGFTIAHQKPGVIKEPIKTLAQASKISNPQDSKYWKFTPDSGAGQHVMAFQKGKMPLKWLTMVRNVEEPGGVGATKEYPGVFFGVDWGLMFPGVLEGGRFGTSKPDFREFFLYGSDFKGRLVFRLVENRPDWEKSGDENLIWQGWMAKDQTPYIMTAKARRERSYIPPEGVSGLPPQLEAKVPAELRWWTPEVKTKDEAFELMDKTRKIFMDNDYIGEGVEYALTKDGEYRLHYFWAKGLKTVKDLKNKDFVLRLRMDGVENTCYFGDNPYALQEGMSLTGVAKDTPGDAPKGEWFDYEGVLPPEHSAAPHTKFSTNVEIISRGRFNSVEQKDGKFIVCFKGGMLSGRFLMEKESGDFDRWRLQKI